MAKKSHLKVRMVPESNPDSKFIYYAKKPTKGEKVKDKLKLKKYKTTLLLMLRSWFICRMIFLQIKLLMHSMHLQHVKPPSLLWDVS